MNYRRPARGLRETIRDGYPGAAGLALPPHYAPPRSFALIQITRLLAKQLRSVFRKAFGAGNAAQPDLHLSAGPAGLVIRAHGLQHAVEYYQPVPCEPDELVIPFELLNDVQGNKNDPVTVGVLKAGVLTAEWEERGIRKALQYALPKGKLENFPSVTSSLMVNPPGLIAALRDANETTDLDSSRYALGCVQVRGNLGQLAATDGRELLVQGGFQFGFQEELLVQRIGAFACRDLPHDLPVQTGRTETHYVVRVGLWTFFLAFQKVR